MRISDWSSDVCSSDLGAYAAPLSRYSWDMSGYCMQQRRADMGSARSAHPVFAGMLAVARNLRHNHSAGAPGAFTRGLFAIGTHRNDYDARHKENDHLDCKPISKRPQARHRATHGRIEYLQ